MKSFVIEQEQGLRNWLKSRIVLNYGLLEKFIRKKLITVNGTKVSSDYRLQPHDLLEIADSIILKEKKEFDDSSFKSLCVFENNDIVLLNKPSGLASQGGKGIKTSVADFAQKNNFFIVHRLDKDTSGLIILAKNLKTAQKISELFAQKKIEKIYHALAVGKNWPEKGILMNENMETVFEKKTEKLLKGQLYTSLILKPRTGKKHQLRIQCAEFGAPIAGDRIYQGIYFPRLMLHAYQLSIPEFGIWHAKAEPSFEKNWI